MDTDSSAHKPTHVDLSLPAYVLGSLDEPERSEIAAHLRLCPHCWRLAEDDRLVAEQIGFAAPQHRPPPHLKARVMAAAAAAARGVEGTEGTVSAVDRSHAGARAAASTAPPRLIHRVEGWGRRRPGWLLAAAIIPWVLAVGLGMGLMLSLRGHTAPPAMPAMAVAPLAGPHGVFGRLAMAPTGRGAFLMLTHMPPLPPGKVYVCWLQYRGTMERGATFHLISQTDDATVLVHTSRPMSQYSAVAISRESTSTPTRPNGTFLAQSAL